MLAITGREVFAAGWTLALLIVCPGLFSQRLPPGEPVTNSSLAPADMDSKNVVRWQSLIGEEKYDQGARLFRKGRYELAATAYKRACEAFSPKACTNLGVMYRSGLGVKKDYALSAEFNRRGCQGGNALGCTNLGIMYWEGSLLKDDRRAVDLFSKGCQGGDSGGCLGLGFMYENGQGVKRDSRRAAEFYRKGCQGGNERSCRQLANLSSVPIEESASEP